MKYLLLQKTVKVKWNSKNKKRYVDAGYIFTKMGDEVEIKTEDLSPGSREKVLVKCDYCGREFYVAWDRRRQSAKNVDKDCCSSKECTGKKAQEAIQNIYGVDYPVHIPGVQEKIESTNIEKYGCKNPFGNKEIQQKIKDTYIEEYGVENPMQVESIRKKAEQTCIEKYGVSCYLNLEYIGENIRGANSPSWKGGPEYHGRDRRTFEYTNWRKEVFERDNYTCQKCGKHGGVLLNAHHIQNWKDNPQERYKVENGITFCESCHQKFHSKYGKRHTNEEMLKEFLNED